MGAVSWGCSGDLQVSCNLCSGKEAFADRGLVSGRLIVSTPAANTPWARRSESPCCPLPCFSMAIGGVLRGSDLLAGTWGTAGPCRGGMETTRVMGKRKIISTITKVLIFYPLQSPSSTTRVVLHPEGDKWSGAVRVSSQCFKSGRLSRPLSCISEDAWRAGAR